MTTDLVPARARPHSSADADPRRRWIAVAAALGAVAFDLGVRSGWSGLAGSMFVWVAAACVGLSTDARRRSTQLLAAAAGVSGAWLSVRSAPSLVLANSVASVLLLLAAGACAGGLDLRDTTAGRAGRHMWAVAAHGSRVAAVPLQLLGRAVRSTGMPAGAVFGAVLGLPLLAILVALLSAADAVFRDVVTLDVNPEPLLSHGTLLAVGALLVAGLVHDAGAGVPTAPRRIRSLDSATASVIAVALVAPLSLFALVQAWALSGGADHVLETAGLTYAEYARSGFFQLLWVAGIVLCVVLGLRSSSALERSRPVAALCGTALLLCLVVVAVALHRLALYQDAFGLTMQRVGATVGAAWIGAVVALVLAAVGGAGRGRQWVTGAAAAVAFALLLAVNAVNIEAVVARANIAHAGVGGPFDVAYAAQLSDDAVPALLAGVDRLPAPDALALQSVLCTREPTDQGWAGRNLARRRAAQGLRSACGSAELRGPQK